MVAVPRLRPRVSAALLLGLIVVALALGFVAYRTRGVLVDAATPALGLAVLFTVMLAVTLTETESQRRALRRQVEQQREAAARLAGELEAARRIQMGTLPLPSTRLPGRAALRSLRACSIPRARWAAISTTSSSWTPIISSS